MRGGGVASVRMRHKPKRNGGDKWVRLFHVFQMTNGPLDVFSWPAATRYPVQHICCNIIGTFNFF